MTLRLLFLLILLLFIGCKPEHSTIGTKVDETALTEPSPSEESTGKETDEKAPAEVQPSKEVVTETPSIKKPKPKPKTPRKRAKIKVKEPVLDVGDMMEGDVVDHRFEFENVGNAPLEILEADVTCGCTTPSVPFLAIEPGESGYIGVQYNSVGKEGPQNAEIYIKTNGTPKKVTLAIKANVKPRSEIAKDSLGI